MTELAIIVPTLNRPNNVGPLIESFLENCPADSILQFIVDWDDKAEIRAIEQYRDVARVGFKVTTGKSGTWPQKINFGVSQVPAQWYLLAADDIRFHKGWWEATESLRNDGFQVIGTNDLGNPRVVSGEHAVHPLVSKAYITQYGTVDQPGKAVHEGYRHWFVDDEFILTAKIRDTWAPCLDARVEHLHPYWKKGAWDETYAKGEQDANGDKELFESRLPLLYELANDLGVKVA